MKPPSWWKPNSPKNGSTGGHQGGPDGRDSAVSPVIGTVMMVTLVLLLATMIVAALPAYADFSMEEETIDEIGPNTVTANPWAGSLGELIQLSDNEADASDVRVRINFTIASGSSTIGNSLNSVETDVQSGSPDMFSNTSTDDVEKAVVDTDGDGEGDIDLEGDINGWQVTDNGSQLKIEFTGSAYTAQPDDSIIIVLGNVENPPTIGTYDVRIQTSGDGNWQDGNITVE